MIGQDTVIEAWHVGLFWSSFAVYGLGVVGLLGLTLLAVHRMRMYSALIAEAEAARIADTVLTAGPAIVVGIVETAKGSQETVTVEVEQRGWEGEDSGTWSHGWDELRRRVRVAPFYLKRPNGDRIRIEPTKEVFLVDDMDGHILVDEKKRIRIAKLVPGEEVIAKGILHEEYDPESATQAYRDMPRGWVMKAAERGKPLFLSSEPLAARFERMKRFHRRAAFWLTGAFLLMQLINFADHARILGGTSDVATVARVFTYITTDDDGDETTHYAVISRTPWGTRYRAKVERDVYGLLKAGMSIPIVHHDRDYLQYGGQASLGGFYFLLCIAMFATAGLYYHFRARAKRPWYHSSLQDKASGRLDPETGLIPKQGLLLIHHVPDEPL